MCSVTRFNRIHVPVSMLAVGVALANAAFAQDYRLTVQPSSPVLVGGQRAEVHVYASMPRPPARNAPYAFASAEFDVRASHPLWTYASGGVIADDGVIDIRVSQPHRPQSGVF